MKASPTRKACTPASRIFFTSSRARMPDSVTSSAVGRHVRQHAQRGLQRDLEGAQVAVVDAEQRRLELERALQLGRVVHLDQHGHVQAARDRLELGHLRVVQAGRDQQDAVGAHGPRLVDLVGVDHEVLAQHRQVARRARLLQVVGAGPGRTGGRSAPTGRRAAVLRHSSARCRPG